MPISAVDAISPAFQHTRQQLAHPFRLSQWARLAFVGLLAGELSSGGCNFNFQVPTHTGKPEQLLGLSLPAMDPAVYALLLVVLVLAGTAFWLLLIYVNSMCRFILFDSVVTRHCDIRRNWSRRHVPGLRYFAWQILFFLAMGAGLIILLGIPAAIALAAGWWQNPSQHLVPLILGGLLVFFALFAFFCVWIVVYVLAKDFIVPMMALENLRVTDAWRRLFPMLKAEKGSYAGYLGLKLVMAIGAAVVIGIISTIAILLMLIPVGGFGAVVVLAGKAAGLQWNLYTISMAVVVGTILLAIILYVMSLIAVPAIVFFPAYSIYFFASRYPVLASALSPPPVTVVPPELPLPPPVPPAPESIG